MLFRSPTEVRRHQAGREVFASTGRPVVAGPRFNVLPHLGEDGEEEVMLHAKAGEDIGVAGRDGIEDRSAGLAFGHQVGAAVEQVGDLLIVAAPLPGGRDDDDPPLIIAVDNLLYFLYVGCVRQRAAAEFAYNHGVPSIRGIVLNENRLCKRGMFYSICCYMYIYFIRLS